jgi:hypothetical protein
MASSTVETDTAPPATRNAPLTETEARQPRTSAAAPGTAAVHEEPLLLPETSATPASYPAASTVEAERKAPEATAKGPEAAVKAPEAAPVKKERPTPEVEALNVLLRGELAAIETYRQVLEKAGQEPGAEDLAALERDHREASGVLWQHIQHHAGEPAKGSGAWGTVAKALEGAAKLFGNVTALAMLKEGEAHGVGLYRDALEHPELGADCVEMVRPLLAKQQEHVQVLEKLIARAGDAG